jgi:hypothetical protein
MIKAGSDLTFYRQFRDFLWKNDLVWGRRGLKASKKAARRHYI